MWQASAAWRGVAERRRLRLRWRFLTPGSTSERRVFLVPGDAAISETLRRPVLCGLGVDPRAILAIGIALRVGLAVGVIARGLSSRIAGREH